MKMVKERNIYTKTKSQSGWRGEGGGGWWV